MNLADDERNKLRKKYVATFRRRKSGEKAVFDFYAFIYIIDNFTQPNQFINEYTGLKNA